MAVSINLGTNANPVGLTCWSANPAAQQRRPANQCAKVVLIRHSKLARTGPIRLGTARQMAVDFAENDARQRFIAERADAYPDFCRAV